MPRRKTQPPADTANLIRRGKVWYFTALVHGVPFVKSLRTDDLAVARVKRAELLAEVADARAGIIRPPPPHVHTWADAVNAWSIHQTANNTESGELKTLKRYEGSVAQISLYLIGEDIKVLSEITNAVLVKFTTHRLKLGRSRATVRNDIVAWGQVLGHARAIDMIKDNPVERFDRKRFIKRSPEKIMPPEDAQISTVLPEISEWSPVAAKLMVWLRETGCRLDEALSVMAADIHPDGLAATLRFGVKRQRFRTIALGRAADLLPDLSQTGRLFEGLPASVRTMSSRYGQFMRQRQDRENRSAMEQGRNPVKLYRFRLHDLRHAFAIASMIDDEDCIYRLQKHLGHTKISTTEIYIRFMDGEGVMRKFTRRADLFGSLSSSAATKVRANLRVA